MSRGQRVAGSRMWTQFSLRRPSGLGPSQVLNHDSWSLLGTSPCGRYVKDLFSQASRVH